MAISQASAYQHQGQAGRDCPAMACSAEGSKLDCAACSRPARWTCAGCYATHYCCRACQKKDWKRHRNDCLKVCITVRTLSGEGKQFDNLPLRTSIGDLQALVRPWAYQQLPTIMKEEHHINVFDMDLLYEDKMLDDPLATLADIGVTDGDELLSVSRIDELPELVQDDTD